MIVMKKSKSPFYYLFISFFAVSLLYSCDTKEPDPVKPANEYLISGEVLTTITGEQAVDNFTNLSPEAAIGISLLIRSDVEVQKVIYKTTFQNQKIMASGLVCLPKTPGTYPILSFQNGTNTLRSLAPSEAANDKLYSIIESIAAMNFIVVIPDYIGFGASSQFPHPYLDAKSTTQSILDMIRATKELGDEDNVVAIPSNDLFIFGYSQGGWATMELQKEIETNYPDEFNLKASSCGAGPYSVEYLNSSILDLPEYPTPYFLAYVLNSYKAIGSISNPLTDFFNEPYASKIPGLFDGNHTGGAINAELTSNLSGLFTEDYRTNFETDTKFSGLRSVLKANSIVAWNISTPTKLFHGEMDEVIPLSMSQRMLADFKAKGVADSKIELFKIPEANHTSGVYEAGLQTIIWFLSFK
jgi:pimeloyl-ACP methyl ester carboxylesterase